MRRFAIFVAAIATTIAALAIPANPMRVTTAQPDGSTVTLRLVGDEYYHYSTTTDGYTVLKTDRGYEYARLDGTRLAATGVLAHDVADRSVSEMALLSTLRPAFTDRAATAEAHRARAARDLEGAQQVQTIDYAKFRGLIILVNYSDVQFSSDDASALYTDIASAHDYTGYGTTGYARFTGSVRDYFYDNSNGNFDPVFDVVGPVDVSYTATQGNSRSRTIFQAAVRAVDSIVDFSQYDADGDGVVDMVYFIVAGYGSNVQGNNSSLLWPYKSSSLFTSTQRFDGKRINVYACSTEMMGQEGSNVIDGIGTICHEFTHVLGFPDLYDTDYESQGQSHDPGEWDIMAGGGYNGYSRTPAGYTIFERYSFGWANPPVITAEGEYTLPALGTSNTGYILKTPVNKEFFMLDNRQSTKWDSALPGHGMIVVRVDSTDVSRWNNNTVNTVPSRNYYEMLRAGGSTSDAKSSDPFPGTAGIHMIDNSGAATGSLRTWNGTGNQFALFNIVQATDGTITFNVVDNDNVQKIVEDFETMPVSTAASSTGVEGHWATWSLTKCSVTAPGEGKCDGEQACSMISPSALTMSTSAPYRVTLVRATAYNTSASDAKLRLYYSLDDGKTWKNPATHTVAVAGNTTANVQWVLTGIDKPVRLRVNMTAGSKQAASPLNLDNLILYHDGEIEQEGLYGDVNGDGEVNVGDVNYVLNIVLAEGYDEAADINGDGMVNVGDVNIILNLILSK